MRAAAEHDCSAHLYGGAFLETFDATTDSHRSQQELHLLTE